MLWRETYRTPEKNQSKGWIFSIPLAVEKKLDDHLGRPDLNYCSPIWHELGANGITICQSKWSLDTVVVSLSTRTVWRPSRSRTISLEFCRFRLLLISKAFYFLYSSTIASIWLSPFIELVGSIGLLFFAVWYWFLIKTAVDVWSLLLERHPKTTVS